MWNVGDYVHGLMAAHNIDRIRDTLSLKPAFEKVQDLMARPR
jgi:hypothetical protein